MKLSILCLAAALMVNGRAFASDDEDITVESDAAVAETKEVKESLAKERAEAKSEKQAAQKVKSTADERRQAAANQLHKTEEEIQKLNAEKTEFAEETAK